ncbi:MAG: type II toxin-antitoxin system PemK/MazF family toxin [Gemmataceae bacterium]
MTVGALPPRAAFPDHTREHDLPQGEAVWPIQFVGKSGWPAWGSGAGHEQSGPRPVVVVSDDAFNAGLAGLVMVVPLTSKVAKSKDIPAHIRIDPPEGGLKTPSVILCDQLRAVSKHRLGKTAWGTVSATTLADVERVLRVLLGL